MGQIPVGLLLHCEYDIHNSVWAGHHITPLLSVRSKEAERLWDGVRRTRRDSVVDGNYLHLCFTADVSLSLSLDWTNAAANTSAHWGVLKRTLCLPALQPWPSPFELWSHKHLAVRLFPVNYVMNSWRFLFSFLFYLHVKPMSACALQLGP